MNSNENSISVCIPTVAALIERNVNGRDELLVQTRWQRDGKEFYSGTVEIPGGWINRFENVYDALAREVYEETGLTVTISDTQMRTKIHSPRNDGAFGFTPFCCHQQIRNGESWIGFVFLCVSDNREPRPQLDEVKDIRWISLDDLRKLVVDEPEKVFTYQLGVLEIYLKHKGWLD